MASRPNQAALPGPARRPASTVLTLVIVCVLIVGGATALVGGLGKHSAERARRPVTVTGVVAGSLAPCPPSGTQANMTVPTRVGKWPFEVNERGTFGSVVSGTDGTAFAIEACGADESELRVVQMRLGQPSPLHASAFVHAALLTSSLVVSGRSLYFGTARLDLSGPTSSPPYELTVYRLDPSTLTFTAWRALGRGYGLTLEAAGRQLVASTGSSLLYIDRTSLVPRKLAGFGRSVAQHLVIAAAVGGYAVSLFTPGAVPPAAGASIEVLASRTGRVISKLSLPSGSDPESLAIAGGRLWAAVGDGLVTTVRVYGLPALTPLSGQAKAGWPPDTAPENIALDATGNVVWTIGISLLECSSATRGDVLAATNQSGPAPVFLSQVFADGGALYAASGAGIGRLSSPPACTP